MPPTFPTGIPFYFYSRSVFFVALESIIASPHFPKCKGDVPKMQKTRACESPGFLD